MEVNYSGKQVIKAGEELLHKDLYTDVDKFNRVMNIVSYWRFTHEIPLENALLLLQQTTIKIDKKAIFAKRLKRYISIYSKLKRFSSMKLKNVQDIGGCRAIVENNKKLRKIVKELKSRPEFKTKSGTIRYKDYIESPKDDGYRSYHLIGEFSDKNGEFRSIELQLRTKLQHDWATALEIVDLFTDQALKSNRGDESWRRFFFNVSAQFAEMESVHLFNRYDYDVKFEKYLEKIKFNSALHVSCGEVKCLYERLNVRRLLAAFANTMKIVDGRLDEISGTGYALIEVNTNRLEVSTTMFSEEQNKEAEEMYSKLEKTAAGVDHLVVALVSTTAIGGVKDAYPNYFADSTEFLKHLLLINKIPNTIIGYNPSIMNVGSSNVFTMNGG